MIGLFRQQATEIQKREANKAERAKKYKIKTKFKTIADKWLKLLGKFDKLKNSTFANKTHPRFKAHICKSVVE